MKYLVIILLVFTLSCTFRIRPVGYTIVPNYTPIIPTYTYPIYVRPRPIYPLGNVYNSYYIPRPRVRTNLPLNHGPIGGRRK